MFDIILWMVLWCQWWSCRNLPITVTFLVQLDKYYRVVNNPAGKLDQTTTQHFSLSARSRMTIKCHKYIVCYQHAWRRLNSAWQHAKLSYMTPHMFRKFVKRFKRSRKNYLEYVHDDSNDVEHRATTSHTLSLSVTSKINQNSNLAIWCIRFILIRIIYV